MKNLFVIRCTVSGGVTGYRTNELKKDGKVMEFETCEEAIRNLPESRTTERGVMFNYSVEEK